MVTIEELETNISKMQELLAAAQNEVQQRTFQDILANLNNQLVKLKSEKQPVEKVESEVEQPKHLFQGVGVIEGKIVKRFEDNDRYYHVESQGKVYQLIINKRRTLDFVKTNYNPDEIQQLLVYPNLVHYPEKDKLPKLSFTLVSTLKEPHPDFKVNEFKLCGFWQMIAVYRGVVISIHRNKTDDLKKLINKFEEDKVKNILRANHIPLLWKDAPVKPFRFNPKLEKDEQGDRYFVEVKARFIPSQGKWGFIELLSEPTLDIPRFYKPVKPSKPLSGKKKTA